MRHKKLAMRHMWPSGWLINLKDLFKYLKQISPNFKKKTSEKYCAKVVPSKKLNIK